MRRWGVRLFITNHTTRLKLILSVKHFQWAELLMQLWLQWGESFRCLGMPWRPAAAAAEYHHSTIVTAAVIDKFDWILLSNHTLAGDLKHSSLILQLRLHQVFCFICFFLSPSCSSSFSSSHPSSCSSSFTLPPSPWFLLLCWQCLTLCCALCLFTTLRIPTDHSRKNRIASLMSREARGGREGARGSVGVGRSRKNRSLGELRDGVRR